MLLIFPDTQAHANCMAAFKEAGIHPHDGTPNVADDGRAAVADPRWDREAELLAWRFGGDVATALPANWTKRVNP